MVPARACSRLSQARRVPAAPVSASPIAADLVRAHGGTITLAANSRDTGATFRESLCLIARNERERF